MLKANGARTALRTCDAPPKIRPKRPRLDAEAAEILAGRDAGGGELAAHGRVRDRGGEHFYELAQALLSVSGRLVTPLLLAPILPQSASQA